VFTPWLAQEANIADLSEAIGIELSVDGTELSVGAFSADILASDMSGQRVLIENQLEQTDHTHLGQCMTYASGLGAKTIIWIAKRFRDEHRKAIEWLNEISADDHAFFAVEIELYKIGDSEMAPRFNVIEQPNNWARALNEKAKAASSQLTESQKAHLLYWETLIERAKGKFDTLSKRMPFKGNWQTAETHTLSPSLYFEVTATKAKQGLRAELYMGGDLAKTAFDYVNSIYEEQGWFSGLDLTWERLDNRRDCRIAIYRNIPIAIDENQVPEEMDWIIKTMSEVAVTTRAIVKQLRNDPTPLQQET